MEGSDKEYDCPNCGEDDKAGKKHAAQMFGRIKICMSSSTSSEYWRYPGYKVPHEHIDFVTSPGVRIDGNVEVDYGEVEKGCNILVIGGINNC